MNEVATRLRLVATRLAMMREEFVASEKERITEGGDVSSDEGRRGILIIKKDEKQVSLSFPSGFSSVPRAAKNNEARCYNIGTIVVMYLSILVSIEATIKLFP